MCAPAEATVTQATPEDRAKERKDLAIKAGKFLPDVTDTAVRSARANELAKLMSGKGRKSTFLTGPGAELGAPMPTTLSTTKLGGY